MMASGRGLLLAAFQVALVASVGGQLLLDRHRLPRVWVRAAPFDPELPIRGRYVSLALEVDADGIEPTRPVTLAVDHGRLVATAAATETGLRLPRSR